MLQCCQEMPEHHLMIFIWIRCLKIKVFITVLQVNNTHFEKENQVFLSVTQTPLDRISFCLNIYCKNVFLVSSLTDFLCIPHICVMC